MPLKKSAVSLATIISNVGKTMLGPSAGLNRNYKLPEFRPSQHCYSMNNCEKPPAKPSVSANAPGAKGARTKSTKLTNAFRDAFSLLYRATMYPSPARGMGRGIYLAGPDKKKLEELGYV
ncbi:MAG: hypothetical protein PHX43_07735 [Alphaproteobacteria bacterium]|nr:hypothetical protein [Alphaproteobacteria bacterium]